VLCLAHSFISMNHSFLFAFASRRLAALMLPHLTVHHRHARSFEGRTPTKTTSSISGQCHHDPLPFPPFPDSFFPYPPLSRACPHIISLSHCTRHLLVCAVHLNSCRPLVFPVNSGYGSCLSVERRQRRRLRRKKGHQLDSR